MKNQCKYCGKIESPERDARGTRKGVGGDTGAVNEEKRKQQDEQAASLAAHLEIK